MQVANVRWSPDGKTIAFIGGLMSDEGVIGGDIYALASRGRHAARSDGESKVVAQLVPMVAVVEADSDGRKCRGRFGDLDAGSGFGQHRNFVERR